MEYDNKIVPPVLGVLPSDDLLGGKGGGAEVDEEELSRVLRLTVFCVWCESG